MVIYFVWVIFFSKCFSCFSFIFYSFNYFSYLYIFISIFNSYFAYIFICYTLIFIFIFIIFENIIIIKFGYNFVFIKVYFVIVKESDCVKFFIFNMFFYYFCRPVSIFFCFSPDEIICFIFFC